MDTKEIFDGLTDGEKQVLRDLFGSPWLTCNFGDTYDEGDWDYMHSHPNSYLSKRADVIRSLNKRGIIKNKDSGRDYMVCGANLTTVKLYPYLFPELQKGFTLGELGFDVGNGYDGLELTCNDDSYVFGDEMGNFLRDNMLLSVNSEGRVVLEIKDSFGGHLMGDMEDYRPSMYYRIKNHLTSEII